MAFIILAAARVHKIFMDIHTLSMFYSENERHFLGSTDANRKGHVMALNFKTGMSVLFYTN